MSNECRPERRDFLRTAALLSSIAIIGVLPQAGLAEEKKELEEVSAVEDLMREHGALNRILLVYNEAIRRIHARERMDPALLKQAATLIREFIENYHEKLEEEHVFPSLARAHQLTGTVDTLLAQHRAGRKVTARIISRCTEKHFRDRSQLQALSADLKAFVRMYRPHEAREDTVVFPAFKKVLSAKEYDRLGDQFEKREHELFGAAGFEGVVAQIATIEKALEIHDLAQFTPKV